MWPLILAILGHSGLDVDGHISLPFFLNQFWEYFLLTSHKLSFTRDLKTVVCQPLSKWLLQKHYCPHCLLESSSQLFLGTSNQAHLPLHPCNSDPSKPTSPRYQRQESSGELKLSRTPERHRRIKRHFSDNPMLLRPANQKVFHHHHYHLPVESFSQSTNNLSVSPTGASISMKQKAFSSSVDNTHLNPVSNHESRLSNSDVENSLHSDASQQTDVSSNASQNLSAKESLKHKDVDSGTESCKEQQNSAKETVVRYVFLKLTIICGG